MFAIAPAMEGIPAFTLPWNGSPVPAAMPEA